MTTADPRIASALQKFEQEFESEAAKKPLSRQAPAMGCVAAGFARALGRDDRVRALLAQASEAYLELAEPHIQSARPVEALFGEGATVHDVIKGLQASFAAGRAEVRDRLAHAPLPPKEPDRDSLGTASKWSFARALQAFVRGDAAAAQSALEGLLALRSPKKPDQQWIVQAGVLAALLEGDAKKIERAFAQLEATLDRIYKPDLRVYTAPGGWSRLRIEELALRALAESGLAKQLGSVPVKSAAPASPKPQRAAKARASRDGQPARPAAVTIDRAFAEDQLAYELKSIAACNERLERISHGEIRERAESLRALQVSSLFRSHLQAAGYRCALGHPQAEVDAHLRDAARMAVRLFGADRAVRVAVITRKLELTRSGAREDNLVELEHRTDDSEANPANYVDALHAALAAKEDEPLRALAHLPPAAYQSELVTVSAGLGNYGDALARLVRGEAGKPASRKAASSSGSKAWVEYWNRHAAVLEALRRRDAAAFDEALAELQAMLRKHYGHKSRRNDAEGPLELPVRALSALRQRLAI